MRTRNSIRFVSNDFDSIRCSWFEQFKFNFLQIFMIQFGQVELACYPNKALYSINSMQKRLLTSDSAGQDLAELNLDLQKVNILNKVLNPKF